MEKLALAAMAITAIALLGLISYQSPGFWTGMTGEASLAVGSQAIIVKFKEDPQISLVSSLDLLLLSKPRVNTKFLSVNDLSKKYTAESFSHLFKQAKNLEYTYELRIRGNAGSAVVEFKNDPNVEYARVSEASFEQKIAAEIEKINSGIKKKGGTWAADYTLQSIMTLEDKKKLASLIVEAKPSGASPAGTSSGGKCTDSDGGINYNVKGKTCVGSLCYTDACSGSYAYEFYCSKTAIKSTYKLCPVACSDGACTTVITVTWPTVLDWRNRNGKNYVSPVRNQGNCGSCWVFGSVGAFEAVINAYYNKPLNVDLSEQDVLSCNALSNQNGCGGGQISEALRQLQTNGACAESCFPYTATENLCSFKCPTWQNSAWKISSYNLVSPNINDMKKNIFENGPIVSSMSVYSDFYSYGGGIYKPVSTTYVGRHAVAIVGYGLDANGATYWIAKNSWGTGWGEAGFFKIYAGTSSIGGENSLITPIPPAGQTQAKLCEDKDLDGYCNWGLGSKPAAGCPACSTLPDCDDTKPLVKSTCQ